MYEEEIPKSIGLLCCQERMCGTSLRKVGQGIIDRKHRQT